MWKLVVVGHDQDRLKNIKDEIEPVLEGQADLRISTAKPAYLSTQMDSRLKLLLFDTRVINNNIFPFLVQIRKSGFSGPIIIMGNPHPKFQMVQLTKLNGVYQVIKPYTPEHLVGLLKNCLNVEKMKNRRDQRFDVREAATLEAYSSDFKAETMISNISRSGVRVEGNLKGLKQGDLLRLHINFDKINKERTMSARVVWLNKDGDKNQEAGLEFVSQKAVYKILLDYVAA